MVSRLSRRLGSTRSRRLFVGGLAGIAAGCLFWSLGSFLEPLELWSADLRHRLDRARSHGADDNAVGAADQIVLVAIDEESLLAIQGAQLPSGQKLPTALQSGWPLRRRIYTTLLQYFTSANAKVIGFDLFFSDPSSDALDDHAFSEGLKNSAPTVIGLPLKEQPESSRPPPEGFASKLPLVRAQDLAWISAKSTEHYPIAPILDGVMSLGHVMEEEDVDGVVRGTSPLCRLENTIVPSFSLVCLWHYWDRPEIVFAEPKAIRLGSRRIPLDEEGRMLLWFPPPRPAKPACRPDEIRASSDAPVGRYRQIPLWQVLEAAGIQAGKLPGPPRVQPEDFAGKILLVGGFAAAMYESKTSPVSKNFPGLLLHAVALENMLSGDHLRRPAKKYRGAIAFGLAFLAGLTPVAFPRWRFSWLYASLACLGLGGTYALVSVHLFGRGIWIELAVPELALIVAFAVAQTGNFALEAAARRHIQSKFTQLLSPEILAQLTENPGLIQPGGEQRQMTVLFSDLKDFTSSSEKLTAPELVRSLNEYLTLVADIIVLEHQGYVDKYIGDGIMAFWGAPVGQKDHARRACYAALDQVTRLEEFRKSLSPEKGGETFLGALDVRIGINTGPMVVGYMGSARKLNYTTIGDAVNVASRLEGANKQFGTHILISDSTHEEAKEFIEVRPLERIRVKGRREPVQVYELLGRRGELGQRKHEIRGHFRTALGAYFERRWDEAERELRAVLELDLKDGPSAVYLRRIAEFRRNPPPADWDGVYDTANP